MSSARVVKASAQEEVEEGRLDRESQQAVDLSLRARSVKARLSPLVDIIVANRHLPRAVVRRAAGAGGSPDLGSPARSSPSFSARCTSR